MIRSSSYMRAGNCFVVVFDIKLTFWQIHWQVTSDDDVSYQRRFLDLFVVYVPSKLCAMVYVDAAAERGGVGLVCKIARRSVAFGSIIYLLHIGPYEC